MQHFLEVSEIYGKCVQNLIPVKIIINSVFSIIYLLFVLGLNGRATSSHVEYSITVLVIQFDAFAIAVFIYSPIILHS